MIFKNPLSILAACEDPEITGTFNIKQKTYPLPQAGQMWLEYDLVNHHKMNEIFCVSTSYRD